VRSITRKVWVGIGAATVMSGAAAPAHAQHSAHGAKDKSTASQDAAVLVPAQSGESYLTDGGPTDTRVRIYRDIALMRGHLLIGGELIEQGRWDDALPHFLHPTEELYGAMERYIKLHKVTPFDRQLKALAQAVKARNKNAYQQAAKVVDERLANALAGFKRFMTGAPFTSFTARTVVEVVNVAKGEYEVAVEGDRYGKPVEYQDGRGFCQYAEQLLTRHAKDFEAVDRLAYAELRRLLDEIKLAWPTTMPPEKVGMNPIDLASKVDTFAKQASRYF
jgi:hypothetical protein